MAYYRPGDRLGGYPVGPDLGEDGPAYGGPSGGYVDERYERGREYAPGYYGAGRYRPCSAVGLLLRFVIRVLV